MELLDAFADVEDLALALLEVLAPTRLATPATLVFPLLVVRRTGGYDTRLTDYPLLQVDAFGADRRSAADLAEAARQRVLAAPATEITGTSVDEAATVLAPRFLPYDEQGTQRYVATYRLVLRRPR